MSILVRLILVISFLAISLFYVSGCSKDNKGNGVTKSLSAPEVEPPVRAASPAVMLAGVVNAKVIINQSSDEVVFDSAFNLEVIRTRFFMDGPAAFLKSLKKIDTRFQEKTEQSKEQQHSCLLEQTITYISAASLPGTETFPMELQCVDNSIDITDVFPDGSIQLSLGVTGENIYLNELQIFDAFSANITMVKANSTGDEVEFWQVNSQRTGYVKVSSIVGVDDYTYTEDKGLYLHVKVNQLKNDFELSVGGNSGSNGVGCGVQMRSNGNLLYASGIFADEGGPNGCDETIHGGTYCVDASSTGDLTEVDMQQCTDASIDSFTLGKLDNIGETIGPNAVTISSTKYTSLTNFSDIEEIISTN